MLIGGHYISNSVSTYHAPDVLQELEITVYIHACIDQPVPVDTLQLDVSIILLETEVQSLVEVDVWSLDCEKVLSSHRKLVEVEVFGEHLHIC